MSELQKVAETKKEKYYFEHNYYTFFEWEENVIKIILMAA